MATLIIKAKLYTMAMGAIGVQLMDNSHFLPKSDAVKRQAEAEELLGKAFEQAGWRVSRQPANRQGHRPDFVVRRPGASYAVELKVGVEGRSDRLIPLWSQACLQAARVAGQHAPLAVVAAPQIASRVAEHILKFAEEYAPDAAAGVIDFAGLPLVPRPAIGIPQRSGISEAALGISCSKGATAPVLRSEPMDAQGAPRP